MNIYENIDYENMKLKCGVCGKWFSPTSKKQFQNLISKAKKYDRKFMCSVECKRFNQGSQKIVCAHCGKEFILKKTAIKNENYCSKQCWYDSQKNDVKENVCQNCGKQFKVSKNNRGRFCCLKCQSLWKLKQIDDIVESNNLVTHRVLRNYYLRHYDKCMNPNCKWDWENNKEENPALQLHHIDGNHLNNTLDNTVLLCPNCHSLTDNYGFKNCHKSTRIHRNHYKKNKDKIKERKKIYNDENGFVNVTDHIK